MLAIDTNPLAHAKTPLAIDTNMLAIDMMPLEHAKATLAIDTRMLIIVMESVHLSV
jgi:hypothetical protein